MNRHPLRIAIGNGVAIIAAVIFSISVSGQAHANDAASTSTVGAPPEPAPTSTVGEPPTLPAVLAHIENQIAPARMMNLHGSAFEDVNANGRRDAGEPAFDGAWFKVSGGGNWFVCGNVQSDGAFGVPVKAGAYHIQPVNVKGFRVTTPQIDVPAMGAQLIMIGYVRDTSTIAEGCDAYNPGRPLKS